MLRALKIVSDAPPTQEFSRPNKPLRRGGSMEISETGRNTAEIRNTEVLHPQFLLPHMALVKVASEISFSVYLPPRSVTRRVHHREG